MTAERNQMTKTPIYIAYTDGTHSHQRIWGIEYCTEKHPKKLPFYAQVLIISGWSVAVILAFHIILKANNY